MITNLTHEEEVARRREFNREAPTMVAFLCVCDERIEVTFSGRTWNHCNVGCDKCRRMYTVPRPQIEAHTNWSIADLAWINHAR